MHIRHANVLDAGQMAEVHVASWKTTYKGLIADSYLDSLSVDKRKLRWERTFSHLIQDQTIFVLEQDGAIKGFASGGASRSPEYPFTGELYTIYLLKEAQRQGYGAMLFDRIVDGLAAAGYGSMLVWALESNSAVAFYEKMGGRIVGRKEEWIGSERLTELALGWDDIRMISQQRTQR